METRVWGDGLAPLNLVLHLMVCLPLLGALTHHLVKVINGTYARGRLVARYARWVTVSYLICFIFGVIIYPAFSFHVRYTFMDAAEPWATGLFEIKEHLLALGCAILPFYYLSSQSAPKLDRRHRRLHAVSVFALSVIVWYAFIVGAVLMNIRGI
ncbi:MAG: hypothetical protein GWP08_13620 [Nitrospiraceae bacterium]|nr:hypothetical protein [Nitrospiraceae bacterium]